MKVLVTGANGFLGKKISKIFFEKGIEVIRTDQSGRNGALELDVTDEKMALKVIKENEPDVVVHTAAITRVDWCETHRKETFKVNVDGARNIAVACRKAGAKMVLLSTDYVFDGEKKGKYTERDNLNPVNVYAKSKAQAEIMVQKELTDFLIARVTVLYGYNDEFDKKCFPMHVIDALKAQKEFYCFVEQYSNPTLINDIALAIFLLLEKKQNGVFNLTGSENLNRLEFAKKIAKVFNLDEGLLKKGSWEKSGFKAKRPTHLDVSIKKLQDLGINMSDSFNGLLVMKQDMEKIS